MDLQLADRYRFIDFLLMFKGGFMRLELVKRFGIGEATASRTIASFIAAYPNVIQYQGSRRGYTAHKGFAPEFKHDALAGLRYVAAGELVEQVDVVGYGVPSHKLQKTLDVTSVATITQAIVNRYLISIDYVSTTSGARRRNVVPHAVFEAGAAWYFRAFDTASTEFRTFKFCRINSVIVIGPTEQTSQDRDRDDSWNRMRVVRLIPHPKNPLPDAQVLDLGISDKESKEILVSEACLGFLLTDFRVDCSRNHKLNYYEYPLALENRNELESVESMGTAPGFKKI